MALWPPSAWFPRQQPVALAAEDVRPDLSAFRRAQFGSGSLNAAQVVTWTSTVIGQIGYATPPEQVPLHVLEAMGWDPIVYVGEQAASAPLKDADLYSVEHADPVVRAETEAWLRPLLPEALCMIARSLSWGAIPYVFDWEVRDLSVRVAVNGGRPRNRTLAGHTHYARAHEVWPGDAELILDDTRTKLRVLRVGSADYGADRAFLSVWDKQFGSWFGKGSRRRAYLSWYTGCMVELWRSRWLERSVDPPRIGYAPQGTIQIDGVATPAADVLVAALMALKNGSSAALPASMDPETKQRLWSVDVLDLPDRSDAWTKALNHYDARKLLACLVPPSSTGLSDATFAGARIPAQMFVEFVQSAAKFVAAEIQKIVGAVHAVNHGDRIEAPRVIAQDIPQAKQKLLLEVFRTVASIPRQLEDGREVTLGEQVGDDLLNQLGLPKVPASEAAREKRQPPPMAPPGPGRDVTSEREERREAAREPEGEDATGGRGEGVE